MSESDKSGPDQAGGRRARQLKIKALHRPSGPPLEELESLPAELLPPASSSNSARQARARLNITFPIEWRETAENEDGE